MAEVLDAYAIGGTPATLPSATTNPLLRDADPALFYLLDFIAWGINRGVNARLLAQVASLPDAARIKITSAVATKLSRDPAPLLTSEQVHFPALAIYRHKAEHAQRTVARHGAATRCTLLYILPPLTAAQDEALSPVLRVVEVVAIAFMQYLQHPAYTPPGAALGADFTTLAGIDAAVPRETVFGAIEGVSKGLHMPALALDFDLREVGRVDDSLLTALERADTSFDLRDEATDTAVADVVMTQTTIP